MEILTDNLRQPVVTSPTASSLLPPKGPEPAAPVVVVDTGGLVETTFRGLVDHLAEYRASLVPGAPGAPGPAVMEAAWAYRRAVHQHARATGKKLPVPGLNGLVRLWG